MDAESYGLMNQYRNAEIDPVVGAHSITDRMLQISGERQVFQYKELRQQLGPIKKKRKKLNTQFTLHTKHISK